jgi:hypothetical protein
MKALKLKYRVHFKASRPGYRSRGFGCRQEMLLHFDRHPEDIKFVSGISYDGRKQSFRLVSREICCAKIRVQAKLTDKN